MIVGFWNIQRASNPDARTFQAAARFGYVWSHLNSWVRSEVSGVKPPDVLFLAEVTTSGKAFAAALTASWTDLGYEARYVPVPNESGGASICSFILAAKRPFPPFKAVGVSARRPCVLVTVDQKTVAGVHLIAVNQTKAIEEAFTMCSELASQEYDTPAPALLLGDMNYPFDALTPNDTAYFNLARFYAHAPGLDETYRGARGKRGARPKVLDYAWAADLDPTPTPPYRYNDFGTVDHAPIAYEI